MAGKETTAVPFAICRDVRLYYEIHGPEGAPVLVLNNGILMNAAASWAPQTAAFARAYRVLQYDCRGQGQSDHPEGVYTMDGHADDLAALLDTLGIGRAHVLGISYGGEVAQAFALRHAPRVSTLLLADTVSEVGPELRLIVEGWRAAALVGDPELFYLVTVPWNFSPAFMTAQTAVMTAARTRYRLLDFPALVRLCDAFLGVAFTPRLHEIAAPTCVMVGEEDLIKGPRYAAIIHHAIAGSELHCWPGAGHATCWEVPAAFNATVLDFLARRGAGE